jgi:hypothetical protein
MVDHHRETIREVLRESLVPELERVLRQEMILELREMTVDQKRPRDECTAASAAPDDSLEPLATASSPPFPPEIGAAEPAIGETDGGTGARGVSDGVYLYGVVRGENGIHLGPIGLEGNEVFTIADQNLALVVHRCPAEPYQSADPEQVRTWVAVHQKVVDAAWEWFGNVAPMGFDTIIQGTPELDATVTARKWLADGRDELLEKLQALEGMAEYSIQVYWEPDAEARTTARESPAVRKIEEEIQSKPQGAAYLYRAKLASALKGEMERLAETYVKQFHDQIRPHVKSLRMEKIKPVADAKRRMLMHLSCLAPRQDNGGLGTALEQIDDMEGFSVRFTGPWPAYSFV